MQTTISSYSNSQSVKYMLPPHVKYMLPPHVKYMLPTHVKYMLYNLHMWNICSLHMWNICYTARTCEIHMKYMLCSLHMWNICGLYTCKIIICYAELSARRLLFLYACFIVVKRTFLMKHEKGMNALHLIFAKAKRRLSYVNRLLREI